jgi:hypothetical protein
MSVKTGLIFRWGAYAPGDRRQAGLAAVPVYSAGHLRRHAAEPTDR